MNILIVDDNKNNRMILKLLLEDYMETHDGVDFFIDEAEDGLIAVNKCDTMDFDIVLMDIMMPNMDGIEATKKIRQKNKKIMIIAVSAVDDSERKKLILNNGAEDYISKPINADIFVSRMTNYIILSEVRKTKKIHSDVVANLFSKDIHRRYSKFILNDDDALAEFWEFFLLNVKVKYEFLSDVVRVIFSIVEMQINISHNNNAVYIEESESKQYFTLVNIDAIPKKVIELLLLKNGLTNGYILTDNKLSLELNKEEQDEQFEELKEKAMVIQSEEIPTIMEDEEIASPITFNTSEELHVLDYIDSDDLQDLEEFANKLNSLMLIVGGDVTEDEVIEIYSYLERLGSILSTYGEVYPISQALTALSVDMSTHVQEFMDNSEALAPMCKAFSNDMSNWISQSFHTGAPSAEFMNDTIVVNCQTISGMLKMDELPAGDDFDDIFDF